MAWRPVASSYVASAGTGQSRMARRRPAGGSIARAHSAGKPRIASSSPLARRAVAWHRSTWPAEHSRLTTAAKRASRRQREVDLSEEHRSDDLRGNSQTPHKQSATAADILCNECSVQNRARVVLLRLSTQQNVSNKEGQRTRDATPICVLRIVDPSPARRLPVSQFHAVSIRLHRFLHRS